MFRFAALTAALLVSASAAYAADTAYTSTTKTTTYNSTYVAPSTTTYETRSTDDVAVIPTLKLGAGAYDVFDDERGGADFKAELHSNFKFLNGFPIIDSVHPFIGAETSNHGGAYVYGGIATDFALSPSWVLTPSLAAGWYNQGGGKDINTSFALRPGLELAYVFPSQTKVGIEVTDTTGIASDDSNVGAVTLNYHMPFGVLGSF